MSEAGPEVRALLEGLFDYAGLFPPAGLGMTETARNFGSYRDGPQAWMLGRLIVPWSRRGEFLDALPANASTYGVSLLLPLPADDEASDQLRAEHGAFVAEAGDRVEVGAIETKVDGAGGIETLGSAFDLFGELFPDAEIHAEATGSCDIEALMDALVEQRARTGQGAGKLRTGSVVPDEIPPVDDVVRFIRASAERDLPWKATAGLHHPLPALRALTYASDAPRGPMFGYLGVVLAAARVIDDPSVADADLRSLLLAPTVPDLDAFSVASLRVGRTRGCRSIGSCSFVEPVEGAQSLALLPNPTESPR